MDDPVLVRPRQALGNLRRDLERPRRVEPAARDELAERLATNQLHRDEADAVRFADFVNDADVRVLEPRGRLRFLQKAPLLVGVRDDVRRQHLQRDLTIQRRVERLVHDPHATPPELRQDPIAPNGAPDQGCHAALFSLRSDARLLHFAIFLLASATRSRSTSPSPQWSTKR